jgi:hypothetical protein
LQCTNANVYCIDFIFRRPNPIPILAPPDHKKNQGGSASADDSDKNADNDKGGENIDHILDNMFTQRREPYEPTLSMKETVVSASGDDKTDDQLNDGMNVSLREINS